MLKRYRVLVGAVCLWVSEMGSAAPAPQLLPPQFTFQNLVKATLGADPCLTVGVPGSASGTHGGLRVDVCDGQKAQALSTIANQLHLATSAMAIEVVGPDGNVVAARPACEVPTMEAQAALYATALAGNPFFTDVVQDDEDHILWVTFNPFVVQFFEDNISDRYGNRNMVAADAFAQVIGMARCGTDVRVMETTAKL